MQNIVQCGKYSPVKFANFVYFCIENGKALPLCGNVITLFPVFPFIVTLHYYIFDILQYFTTKLYSFTKCRKLFPTLLKSFSNLEVCLIGEWSIAPGIIGTRSEEIKSAVLNINTGFNSVNMFRKFDKIAIQLTALFLGFT